MNKRVTIQEVADQAGVSKTTVSRYLNKKYHKMSPATKKRIKAVIEELDYRPSRQAQALLFNWCGHCRYFQYVRFLIAQGDEPGLQSG
ncbi:LacI family DNA-binding transcriptional regulator [Aerococcus urinae]|uniref:LacI family DNA-binding transcriptional regulator n=1 Tax=Aerococcus urinae TaxID=1376 RepID=UPI00254D55AC|nr:helix-turn-helix transcriptional regulator [Aerococcus urinae]MDK6449813.1 helix-turn-helix transcriptional regulator [Aerococcus urinae]